MINVKKKARVSREFLGLGLVFAADFVCRVLIVGLYHMLETQVQLASKKGLFCGDSFIFFFFLSQPSLSSKRVNFVLHVLFVSILFQCVQQIRTVLSFGLAAHHLKVNLEPKI